MIVPFRLVFLSLLPVCVATAAAGDLKPKFVFKGHETRLRSVAFSPDGKLLVTRGNDPPVRLWDLVNGTDNRVLGEASNRYVGAGARFAPDGKKVYVGAANDAGETELWDLTPGQPKVAIKPPKVIVKERTEFYRLDLPPDKMPIVPHLVSPDGKFAASLITYTSEQVRDKSIKWRTTSDIVKTYMVRDTSTREEVPMDEAQEKWLRAALSELTMGDLKKLDPTATKPVISADRTVLAALTSVPSKAKTGLVDVYFTLWDMASRKKIAAILKNHPLSTWAVATRGDIVLVASGCEDGIVRVWEVPRLTETSDTKKGK
jgi:WD40 repeat protein